MNEETTETIGNWQQHLEVVNRVLAEANIADAARRHDLVYPPSLPDSEVVELTKRAKERAERRIATLTQQLGVGDTQEEVGHV